MNVRQRFSEARSRNRGCLGAVLAVGLFLVVLVATAILVTTPPATSSAQQLNVYATLTAMAPSSSNCPAGQIVVEYEGQYPVDFGCQPFEVATQVAIAQTELNGTGPTPTPANVTINGSEFTWQQLAALGTPMPGGTLEASNATGQSYAEGSVSVSGFPVESYPVRWGNNEVQTNTNPIDSAAWIIAEPGVLSADDIADCGSNLSCVWSGGASVDNLLENSTGTILCPEGGYIKVTLPQAIINAGEYTISVSDISGTSYTVVLRCPYAEGEGDNSLPVEFQTEHPGRVKIMRYPVPYEFGGFFSFEHLEQDLANSAGTSAEHDLDGADNCGNQGCDRNLLILGDLNHGTLGVYDYQGPSNWRQLYSNAIKPSLAPSPTLAQ